MPNEDQKRMFLTKGGMTDKHDVIFLDIGICGFSKKLILTQYPKNIIHSHTIR